ncbi:MAG: ethanolamine ammonia-lyase reactivating factor EutA [Oscillospiraceae bacterium]
MRWSRRFQRTAPLLVLIETDIAKAVGILMRSVLGSARDVVCIDCVRVEQGDYMDLGKPLFDGLVIPIVVKSLLFG